PRHPPEQRHRRPRLQRHHLPERLPDRHRPGRRLVSLPDPPAHHQRVRPYREQPRPRLHRHPVQRQRPPRPLHHPGVIPGMLERLRQPQADRRLLPSTDPPHPPRRASLVLRHHPPRPHPPRCPPDRPPPPRPPPAR